MSEFNDPELRQQLGQLSGPYPDDNAAFAAWQKRVGQARRRRAVGWTTGVALSLLIGTVSVAALNSPGRHTLVPGKSADTSADVSISSTTESSEPESTESSEPETSEVTTLAPDTTPSTEAVESSVPETEVEATVAAGAGGSGGSGGSNKGPSNQHAPATSTAPSAPAVTQTFPSTGGSITVQLVGGNLTITHISASGGFQAQVDKQSGSTVGVRFDSSSHRSSITVRIVGGAMVSHVSEKSEDNQGSEPATTDQNDHGNDTTDSRP